MNGSILIAGCGYVGTELGVTLSAQGFQVYGARRSPESLPDCIESITLDITDQVSLQSLPDVEVLVYAISADKFEESAYQSAYPDGLSAILAEFERRRQPPRHVFFVSSTAVYGQSDGVEVNEDSPTVPSSFSGELMLKAEQRLAESPIKGTVLRLSGIYGPGRERLINQVKQGAIAPAEPEIITNRIHRDDAAGVIHFLIQRVFAGGAIAPCYLVTDSLPVSLHEVTRWLAERMSIVPKTVMSESARRRSNKRCSNARLLELGYQFKYPTFREGYEQILQLH